MTCNCFPSDPVQRSHPETTERQKRAMMIDLYRAGWGYHNIADLSGRTHDAVREFIFNPTAGPHNN